MAGLSFEKKRAPRTVGYPAAVPVRVYGPGSASVDGVPVVAAPGEEIQQAVLNRLQSLAISVGAPIHATVHDDLAGCVVPLEVSGDGSSRVTGEPVRLTAPGTPGTGAAAETPVGTPQAPGRFGPPPVMDPPPAAAGTKDAGADTGADTASAAGTAKGVGGAAAGAALGLGLPFDEPAPRRPRPVASTRSPRRCSATGR
ncbi:hypothetical protein ACFQ3Z_27250 [Streptomyces nogalater]